MLKKLIKYEWKAVWKALLIINSFTVLTTVIGMLILWHLKNSVDQSISPFTILFIFTFYYLTITGVSFAMSIYTGIRFYRNLYTDEGYLMHTLPVTGHQLVLSKLLVHSLCQFTTRIMIMISVGLLLLPLLAWLLEEEDLFFSYLIKDLTAFIQASGIPILIMLLAGSVSGVISMISNILSIYCAVTLGQTFRSHKVMWAILCYIGIHCLLQSVSSILFIPRINMIGSTTFNPMDYIMGIITSGSVMYLLFSILFYCITLHMMTKKLNLD